MTEGSPVDRAGAGLRVGLIGAGRIADLHVAGIRASGASLAAVASSTPERAAEAQHRLGARRACDSVEELLADDSIDVVHITSPSGAHPSQVEAALRAGKHVVCEKPVAASAADAGRLAALADDRGLIGTVAYSYRFHPVAREARSRVSAGTLGRLIDLRAGFRQEWLLSAPPGEWRLDPASAGPSRAFADIGSHLVDLLEFVTGDRIASVVAASRSVVPSTDTAAADRDDAVTVVVRMRSGAIGSLAISQVALGHGNDLTIEIFGTTGSLSFDQSSPDRLTIALLGDPRGTHPVPLADRSTLSPDARALGFAPTSTPADYENAFADFIHDSYAALDGHASDALPTFHTCARATTLREAVFESLRTGRWTDTA